MINNSKYFQHYFDIVSFYFVYILLMLHVVIAFQGTSVEVPSVDNHGVILSGQAKGLGSMQ